VEVLTWGPDRGNPTLMRQGHGSEFTGRSPVRRGRGAAGVSVRACSEEAIGALWLRTRVTRRKAFGGWVSWPLAAMPSSCWSSRRSGDVIASISLRLIPGDLSGSGRWPVGPRTSNGG
jgi:hypothetical protein